MAEYTYGMNMLFNYSTRDELRDTLVLKSNKKAFICPENLMYTFEEVKPIRTKDAVSCDAKLFIDEFYASIDKFESTEHRNRWSEIEKQIEESDDYIMKTEELEYGATVAWRNAPRCPGRSQWKNLKVLDCRDVGTAEEMFKAMCDHLDYATNEGKLRPAITVFPPRQKGRCDFRVWNYSMIGYACYKQSDGTILGDPFNLELTQAAQKLGWKGRGTKQDILPLIVQAGDGKAHFFDIPDKFVLQVPLCHPIYKDFADLGYKWFALPGVSSLKLDCGGLEFSAIPFSGWYMDSEIVARYLGDKDRFNLAPVMADIMSTNTDDRYWRDYAFRELVFVVEHSFREAKITIDDHQTACKTFIEHFKSEHVERGGCPTEWVWVNPSFNRWRLTEPVLTSCHQSHQCRKTYISPHPFAATGLQFQETLFYWIKPLYDYQDQPWKTYNFGKHTIGTLDMPVRGRPARCPFWLHVSGIKNDVPFISIPYQSTEDTPESEQPSTSGDERMDLPALEPSMDRSPNTESPLPSMVNVSNKDKDFIFFQSIASCFKRLPSQQKAFAKSKIEEILCKVANGSKL